MKSQFVISSGQVSFDSNRIIRKLLTLDPSARLTALGALKEVENSARCWRSIHYTPESVQEVPDVGEVESDSEKEIAFQVNMTISYLFSRLAYY